MNVCIISTLYIRSTWLHLICLETICIHSKYLVWDEDVLRICAIQLTDINTVIYLIFIVTNIVINIFHIEMGIS